MEKQVYNFSIAELVASFMINNNTFFITNQQLKKYFLLLKSKCKKKKNLTVYVDYSIKFFNDFKENYSDLFDIDNDIIKLKSGVTLDDLRSNILSYVPHYQLILLFDALPNNTTNYISKTI